MGSPGLHVVCNISELQALHGASHYTMCKSIPRIQQLMVVCSLAMHALRSMLNTGAGDPAAHASICKGMCWRYVLVLPTEVVAGQVCRL